VELSKIIEASRQLFDAMSVAIDEMENFEALGELIPALEECSKAYKAMESKAKFSVIEHMLGIGAKQMITGKYTFTVQAPPITYKYRLEMVPLIFSEADKLGEAVGKLAREAFTPSYTVSKVKLNTLKKFGTVIACLAEDIAIPTEGQPSIKIEKKS